MDFKNEIETICDRCDRCSVRDVKLNLRRLNRRICGIREVLGKLAMNLVISGIWRKRVRAVRVVGECSAFLNNARLCRKTSNAHDFEVTLNEGHFDEPAVVCRLLLETR